MFKPLPNFTFNSAYNDCLRRWLNSFVSRVLHHLKAFLSQAASSHEERLETHRIILARLVALTERSQAFLKALEMEVDARYQEGMCRLSSSLGQFTNN